MNHATRIAALFTVAATALSGCSSSTDPDSVATTFPAPDTTATGHQSKPNQTKPERLENAVQAYSDAYLTGHAAAAYKILSPRCKAQLSRTVYWGIVSAAKARYGRALDFDTYTSTVHGDTATVTYTYSSAPEIDQTDQPWTYLNGAWRYDNC
jgi:hypothetical protein